MSLADDPALTAHQYATPDHLSVRQRTHQLYGETPFDLPQIVLDQITWRGDEWVVDVGAGTGLYASPTLARTGRYVAGDLSAGILAAIPPEVQRVNLDAQQLPVARQAVDVLLANHMLYHVPDQAAALREFARVLRPGGVVLAATNSDHNMPQLQHVLQQAFTDLAGVDLPATWLEAPTRRFSLENGGALLATVFDPVQRVDFSSDLLFPAPEPVIAYLASSVRDWVERFRPHQVTWPALADALQRRLRRHIADHGVFRVTRQAGVFVAYRSPD